MMQELSTLKDHNALVYMMLWELVFHFHNGVNITETKGFLSRIKSGRNISSPTLMDKSRLLSIMHPQSRS